MSPSPSPSPPPPSLLPAPPSPPPPPESLVTSEEVESINESDSESVEESDSESVEESDSEDVEESMNEEDNESSNEEDNESSNEEDNESDSVGSEPLSPHWNEPDEEVSIEELIEELYTPIFPGVEKKDDEFWTRYFQQVRDSEGFDIKDYPGLCIMTTVQPLRNYLKDPAKAEMLKGYAGEALGQYNEKNDTKYEVKDILKVNGRLCRDVSFYITFTVTNGEKEYFQAKVVRHIDQSLDFPIVRPRVKEGRDIE